MAKKSSGKHYTSKGERISSMGNKNTDPGQRLLNQLRALKKGRDVIITLPEKAVNAEGKQFTKMVKTKINGKEWVKKRQSFGKEKADAE